MKKLFFLLIGGALAIAPEATATVIYGYQTWEPDTETPFRGPVKINSENPAELTPIADCSDMGVVYGGYYYNYHWYGQGIVKGTQSSVEGLYEIDMTTGARTLIAKGGSKMIDLTYDYSTGKVYGIRNGNSWFAEFNPATGESSLLGRFAENGSDVYMLALAAAFDGTIYGVSSTDFLYTINPTDGSIKKVGSLGVDAGFDQTMAFDYNTGTLYWANNGDYNLYTIDTSTGAATLIGSIGPRGCSSMGSLFVPFINAPAAAPDRVTSPVGTGSADAVVLSWVNPAVTVAGDALTTLDGVLVIRDGEQIADVKLNAANIGAEASYTDTNVEADHDYEYELVPYNEAGRGGVDTYTIKVHVGSDRPGQVSDLKATSGDGSAILSWNAPTVGAAGGIFNPADVTAYKVSRGSRLLATLDASTLTYEDKVSFGTYSYTVTAVSATGDGTPTTIENVLVKPGDWIVMTNGEQTLATGVTYKFYDEGGPSADYYNNRRDILVLAPEDPDGYVTAKFTKFSLETYGDYLSVYQGRGIEGELIGKFNSSSLPAELSYIESSAADGCLTFLFYSDIMEPAPGWEAEVEVKTLKACDMGVSQLEAPSVAVAGAATTCNVTVVNKGTAAAKGWKVELLSDGSVVGSTDGSELASRGIATVAVEFTPETPGDIILEARVVMAGDLDDSNNLTEGVAVRVLPAGSAFVDIFSEGNDQLYILPVSFMAIESISEIILPADLLTAGAGLNLSVVSFPLATCEKSYSQVPFRLWAGTTELDDLVAGIIPGSQLTKVFDDNVDVNAGSSELGFSLPKALEYKGGNLAIMLHKLESPTDNGGITFRGEYDYSGTHPGCSRFDSRWSSDYEPIGPEETFGYAAQNMRPDIRLIFTSGNDVTIDIDVDTAAGISLAGNMLTAAAGAQVYTTAGVLVATLAPCETVTLPAGLYVVSTPTGATKIAVK